MFNEELGRLRVPIIADLEGLRSGERAALSMMMGLDRKSKPIGQRIMHSLFPSSVIQGIFQGVGQGLYGTLRSTLLTPFRMFWSTVAASSEAAGIDRKFEAVFDNLTDKADKWSRDFASKIGRAVIDVKDMMSRFQDTLVPIGFDRSLATTTSMKLSRLSTDLSASENITQREAADRIVSGMVGNHEALRRFGVIITENSLKAQLMQMGIEGGTKAATEQQKVIARLNILLESTRDAQGTAAKAAGSYAMESQALAGVVRGLSATVGDVFTPSLAVASRHLREMISDIDSSLGDTASVGKGLADSFELVLDNIKPMRNEIVDFFSNVGDSATRFIDKFSDSIGDAGSLGDAWRIVLEGLKDESAEVAEEIGRLFGGAIADGISNAMGDVVGGALHDASLRMTASMEHYLKNKPYDQALADQRAKYSPNQLTDEAKKRLASPVRSRVGDLQGLSAEEVRNALADAWLDATGDGLAGFAGDLAGTMGGSTSQVGSAFAGMPLLDGVKDWANDLKGQFASSEMRDALSGAGAAALGAQQMETERERQKLAGIEHQLLFDQGALSPEEKSQLKRQLRDQQKVVNQMSARDQRFAAGVNGDYATLEAPGAGAFPGIAKAMGDGASSFGEWMSSLQKEADSFAKSAIRDFGTIQEDGPGSFNFSSAESLQSSIQQALSPDAEAIRIAKEQSEKMSNIKEKAQEQVDAIKQLPQAMGEKLGKFLGYSD